MEAAEEESDGVGFEHYTPNHPLPDEIRAMKRDDTICRYCGVSYLIHNEIKALETQLKLIKAELEHYQGSEERERQLKQKVNSLELKELELQKALTAKDTIISSLQSDVKSSEELNRRLHETNKGLEGRLTESIKTKELIGFKLSTCQSRLPSLLAEVKNQKLFINKLYKFVQKEEKDRKDEIHDILTQIRQKERESFLQFENRISHLEREKSDLEKSQKLIQEKSNDTEKELQSVCDQLKESLTNKSEGLEKSEASLRLSTLEMEQFKDNLKTKNQAIESLNAQLRSNSQNSEQRLKRVQLEVNQKIAELLESRKLYQDVQNQLIEQQCLEKEIQRKASLSINETNELRDRFHRAQVDLDALKAERELMIEAHQNRIAELKESFKNKMYEVEKWPDKLEAALSKEREKHNKNMRELEDKLKENFILEMQIEKQKHGELVQKYLSEFKEKENKLKSQLSDLENQLRSGSVDYQRQLEEVRKHGSETEDKLRAEIENLKCIIRGLEEKLAKAGTGQEDRALILKEQLQQSNENILSTQEELNSLQQQLTDKQQQVLFLQETVRKECEERFELTESLSEAREELLRLKKPPGGYSNSSHASNKTPSRLDSTGSSRSTLSQSNVSRPQTNISAGSFTPTNQNGGHYSLSPTQNESRISVGSPEKSDPSKAASPDVTSSNINVEFKKKSAKPSGHLKGKTIAENRRRIAALLGKR